MGKWITRVQKEQNRTYPQSKIKHNIPLGKTHILTRYVYIFNNCWYNHNKIVHSKTVHMLYVIYLHNGSGPVYFHSVNTMPRLSVTWLTVSLASEEVLLNRFVIYYSYPHHWQVRFVVNCYTLCNTMRLGTMVVTFPRTFLIHILE